MLEDFTIGVAEDEEEIRRKVCATISGDYERRFPGRRIETVQFRRAAEVVDFLLEEPDRLDLLFLDLRFDHTGGGDTGLDILPDVRSLRPSLPIWLVTGTAVDEHFEIAKRFHPIDYILKPIRPDELCRKLHLHLSSDLAEQRRALFDDWYSKMSERRAAPEKETSDVESGVLRLLSRLYPNIVVHSRAASEIIESSRSVDMLKTLSRLNADEISGGARFAPYTAVEGVFELRVNQFGRFFVRRNGAGYELLAVTEQHEHIHARFHDTLRARLRR